MVMMVVMTTGLLRVLGAVGGLRLGKITGKLGLGEVPAIALIETGIQRVGLGGCAAQILDIGLHLRLRNRPIAIRVHRGNQLREGADGRAGGRDGRRGDGWLRARCARCAGHLLHLGQKRENLVTDGRFAGAGQ